MRDVVNKNVTEEQLMRRPSASSRAAGTSMKLYFMIGLPTEEDERRARHRRDGQARARGRQAQGRARARAAEVTVSVSTHVPKPHTPFQWCAMDTRGRASSRSRAGSARTRRPHAASTLRMHDSRHELARGHLRARRSHARPTCSSARTTNGARFDSWDEQLKLDVWEEAFDARRHRPGARTSARSR